MLTLHSFITFFGSIVFGLGKIPHVFVGNPFGDFNPLFEIDNPRDCSSLLFRHSLSSLRSFGPSGAPFCRHDVKMSCHRGVGGVFMISQAVAYV